MLKTACLLDPLGALATKDLAGRSLCQAPVSLAPEFCHSPAHTGPWLAWSGGAQLDGLERDTLVYTAIIGAGRALVKMDGRLET